MHPDLMIEVAKQRIDDMQRAGAKARLARAAVSERTLPRGSSRWSELRARKLESKLA